MSSDEDIDVTSLPLNERIKCNGVGRYESEASNSKTVKGNKKKGSQQGSKKFPVAYTFKPRFSPTDQWVVPETPNPYYLGSKKRHNRDKNEPATAKSKRTCLGSSFFQPEWRNFRKKNGVVDRQPTNLEREAKKGFLSKSVSVKGKGSSNNGLGVDQTQLEPTLHDEPYEKSSENSNPLSEIDGASSSLGSSSSASNERMGERGFGNSFSQCDYPLSIPSTSRCNPSNLVDDDDDSSQKDLFSRGVRFFDDEDSDSEESKYFNGGSLRAGRYFPEYLHRVHKIIGKGARRILDSDESSENEWHSQYRRPNNYLSPDSDDSSDGPIMPRKKHFTKHSLAQLSSSDSNENSADCIPVHPLNLSKDMNSPCSSKSKCTATKAADQASQESNCNATTNSPYSVPSQSGQNCTDSPFLALRNRFSRSKSSRRSISPHPRILNNHRQGGLPRSFGQREYHHRHLVSDYPDIFDAEDSSEVEFFTAHSYSDTENSTESVGATNVNGTLNASVAGHRTNPANARNSSTIILDGSSDEEISVIFSGGNTPTSDRISRRGRNRGSGLRRRRPRVSGRTPSHSLSQDVSESPDPVAQVRQVEEDEQFARMLQAEFDAEVTEMATYVSDSDSDESVIIDPVGLDPVPVPFAPPPCQQFAAHSPPVLLRGMSRVGVHANLSGGRRRRGRRNVQAHQGDPWMYQFARVLGLGPAHHHHYHHHHHHHHGGNESDYETLIQLAETVGDAVPRGLHKAEINRLPTRKFFLPGSASASQECDEVIHKRTELNKECQVCLSDYENGDILRILPCFHEFHTPCIDPWLKINHTCPVCRVEVSFDA